MSFLKTTIDIDRLDDMYRLQPAEREEMKVNIRRMEELSARTKDESVRQSFVENIKFLNALLQRRSLREELEEQGVEVEVVERIG